MRLDAVFFGHLKLRDLYMSLTYFDRCILTLYGIRASNMFFFVKHSFQICIVSQITPSNKGNLLLSIQDALLFVGGCPVFSGCPCQNVTNLWTLGPWLDDRLFSIPVTLQGTYEGVAGV